MQMQRFSYSALALLALFAFVSPQLVRAADAPETMTQDDVITGTMNIDFKTRTTPDSSGDLKEGSSALGAKDLYTFSFNVGKTTEYAGKIERQPNLYTSTLGRQKQSAMIAFDVGLSVLNPKNVSQKKTVGKWVGVVPIDVKTGAYDLAGGRADERPLRIAIDPAGSAKGFTDAFAGRLVGKAEKKEGLAAYTYRRLLGDKEVTVVVKRSDPMKFEDIKLAKGPAEVYPSTTVNGRLDYDYETGNWFTDGIRFKYSLDGKDYEDIVTGSIKWVEDADRKNNGKGAYEFNLRFNEDKNKPAAGEAAAFDKVSAEDAFFVVDNSIPCLTGKVAYVDTMMAGKDEPAASKITYNLNANKLTKQQVVNFFKLWLVCVGPTNDE